MNDHSRGLGAEFSGFFSPAHVRILYDRGEKIRHGIVHHHISHSGIGFKSSGGSLDWPIQFGGFIE